jgi:hypothetical protein
MEMFTGCGDHVSVLIFFISYFLSAFVSLFSLQTVPYFFFLLSVLLIFSPVLMMMKMMTNFQSFRIYKAFVHFGTVLYFALSLFVHCSTSFFTDTFLLGFRACTCIFDIMWCCMGMDTNQNFESELNYNIL